MAQVIDFNIAANPSGLNMRTELNGIIEAILTQNSGTDEPLNPFSGMEWVDKSDVNFYYIKKRNLTNDDWEVIYVYDVLNNKINPFGEIAYTIETVNDFVNIPTIYKTAIVKDLNRGGTFIWSATGTANGGTVFAGATGYWNRQYDGAVNVKWFGAKGDGVTDDISCFNLAYNTQSDGGVIEIPEGVYILSTAITGTKKVIFKYFGDIQTNLDLLQKLPGAIETVIGNSNFTYRNEKIADNASVIRTDRIANFIGGTHGFVSTANLSYTNAGAGNKNYEWTTLSKLDNYATLIDNSENVALYAQAIKNSDGKTWAGCFEIQDKANGFGVANGDTIGIEVTVNASGGSADTNFQRVGIHIAGSAASSAEWGRAYWASGSNIRYREVYSNNARFSKAVFYNNALHADTGEVPCFIRDEGSASIGINLRGASYTTDIAIALKEGHAISFESTSVVKMSYISGNLEVSGARCIFDKGIGFNSVGNIAASATSGASTLPSNPSGFIIINIDGLPYKMPYYNS